MSVGEKVHQAVETAPEQDTALVLRSQTLVRMAERGMRFLLGAVLAGGEIFGGFAPFGVGFVACSGSGVDGLCALMGAVGSYLVLRGVVEGLRYAAACVLVFSVAFAFYDAPLYRKGWFMPLTAAAMVLVTGAVYLTDQSWSPATVVFFTTEVLLAGGSALFYRTALEPWQARREKAFLTTKQTVSLFFLVGTLLVALSGVTVLEGLSLGRALGVLCVLALAHSGGLGLGAAAGVAVGLGMDLAAGGSGFYTMAYGFSGFLAGAGWRQGRLFGAISFAVYHAVAVLWIWELGPYISSLYEVFLASVLFLLLPRRFLTALTPLVRPGGEEGMAGLARYAGQRLEATAGAFRRVRDSLRAAFPPREPNDEDPSTIFDRTAERVCGRCALRNTCWEHDYISTYNALNDALPAMMERGKGEAGDFPAWFASRCLIFPSFLQTANEELSALRYRRQYKARLRDNRGAVCRQYETLADILTTAAAELSVELTPDPLRRRQLKQHLAAQGLEAEGTVYYDAAGHLRCEVTGAGAKRLAREGEARRLGQLMGVPLVCCEETCDRVVFREQEAFKAVAGVAARRREGQTESGDTGTWFKGEDGSLFVLLCDGMGSGGEAHRESALAVELLEGFLRTGMDPAAALRTVNGALALKNEETGAFTTVDLLRLDLFTGAGEVCKLGAAPTFVRRDGVVSRITGAALPAGLTDGQGVGPDVTGLELKAGDVVLLLSDGVADAEEDGWVRDLLAAFEGDSPRDLARAVMEESEKRVGPGDDRTAVAVVLRERKAEG